MIPATLPARCWCGRSQSRVRGCLFHAGDLEQRVDRLMRAVRVVDAETGGAELSGAPKWLGFVCASIVWHLLPTAKPALAIAGDGYAVIKVLGNLTVSVATDAWEARQLISAEELAELHAESVMARWPWVAS